MNEIPDQVFVPLGRRGFDPIPIKFCHNCQDRSGRISMVQKVTSEKQEGGVFLQEIDYEIKCDVCGGTFFYRIRHVFDIVGDKRRKVVSTVNILNEKKEDLGWVGNI